MIREHIATGAPLYVTVSGDGLDAHWIEVDAGLHIVTGREGFDVRSDPEESAHDAAGRMPVWSAGEAVEVGSYRVHGGELYSCLQAHTTQSDWMPNVVPALWRHWPKKAPGQQYPPWVQPTGAHDAYKKGDRVMFEGAAYESKIDANVWGPVVYPAGWLAL
jgi:hypothetical protein